MDLSWYILLLIKFFFFWRTRYHIPRSWLKTYNNVLVIFEETDKTPFEISIATRSTETICAQVSEKHYPPLRMWSHSEFDGKLSLMDKTPEMHLQCDKGHTISSIEFASYGNPKGSCQKFSQGKCHAANSLSIVSQVCFFFHFKNFEFHVHLSFLQYVDCE